jgi:hypothetical protein
MTVVVVFEVVFGACIFHGVSPWCLSGCELLSFLPDKLAMEWNLATREELVLFDRLKLLQ